jgi:hypothetical protein
MNPRSDSNAGPRSVVVVSARRAVARQLASTLAGIGVIDRHNYRLFQALPDAWLLWGALHTFLLKGFGKRVAVCLNRSGRGSRIGAARSLASSGCRCKSLRLLRSSPGGAR